MWQWLTFIPWVVFVPYGLIAKFASYFLEQHYWTSRVIIMHAFFMTLTEISKFPSVVSSAQARYYVFWFQILTLFTLMIRIFQESLPTETLFEFLVI